eukprot:8378141-Pyramimonas_sp.AAC.1
MSISGRRGGEAVQMFKNVHLILSREHALDMIACTFEWPSMGLPLLGRNASRALGPPMFRTPGYDYKQKTKPAMFVPPRAAFG